MSDFSSRFMSGQPEKMESGVGFCTIRATCSRAPLSRFPNRMTV